MDISNQITDIEDKNMDVENGIMDISNGISVGDDLNTDEKKKIGERLASLRKEYGRTHDREGINQEEFAEVLGLYCTSQNQTQKAMSNIEKGKVVYRLPLLQRYSQVCNVSIDYIVNGSEFEKREDERDEYTALDVCRNIIALDRSGLIDDIYPTDDDVSVISFRCADDYHSERGKASLMITKFLQDYIGIRNILKGTYLRSNLQKQIRESPLEDLELYSAIVKPMSIDGLIKENENKNAMGILTTIDNNGNFLDIPD